MFIKYCVIFQEFSKVCHLSPRQHSAAIGCTKNYQPIGVTVYNRIALGALRVSNSDLGEVGVEVNCDKNTIFPGHPVDLMRTLLQV